MAQENQRRKIVLRDLHTAIEWQCAHNIIEHAVPGERVCITYETPNGDLTLCVKPIGVHQWAVSKGNHPKG